MRVRRSRDDGFTMMEVVVALALISAMMAALGTYFAASVRTSRYQSQIQTATRLAQAGMESARGFGGPTLLVGRAQCGSCLNLSVFDTYGYLSNTTRWDAPVSGVTPTVPIPDTQDLALTANKVKYYRYFLVGRCWQPRAGGTCGTDPSQPVQMVRLVVAITWTSSDCKYAMCIRAATSLFSAEPADPVFSQ
ncbi:type II secretion system protein [Winogradskya humida]|uniref:Prepilin-type N-terminal cleavage/methylation domain-containing protein n=1 Tax=Winogradskya humida TaxID=113566 RepID=A0ABQ4A0Q1_9ACTN|nr:type II secretion system protein [Actinoplanes humidus]GIE24421.1 hypothetical protein Ahu01nite_075230 [Actinoplanes humidus]